MSKAFWLTLLAIAQGPLVAAEPQRTAAGLELFEKQIRPALIQHCYECHSSDTDDPGGDLRLDSRDGLLGGGASGPAVVAGDPDQSLLVAAMEYRDLEMPPDGRLPPEVVAAFRRWIALGAPDPRVAAREDLSQRQAGADDPPGNPSLWSLQPVVDPPLPPVDDADWPRSASDRFILSRLEQSGLAPNPDADPATLVRRVAFDLIGLPPTPETVAAFVAEPTQTHLARIVDRYLASPQFGQRWGRHWLDVARYGESAGSSRDVLILYAWRYRDYVIDAYNADLPFDRFVTEQIAGDLLPADSIAQRDRLRVATGLLAIGSKSLNGGNLTYDVVDDQIDVVSKSVLGLTVACARCHDHKFDPVPTSDYYALAGIFLSTDTRYGGNTKRPQTDAEKARVYLTLGEPASQGKRSAAAQRQAAGGDDPRYAVGVQEARKIVDSPILIRGEKGQTGEVAPRGFLSCIETPASVSSDAADRRAIDDGQSGRLQLAQWMVDPSNPLTPRVAVNRIWQHLFGNGLVATVDNFGFSGLPPTHPQLLDHLAHRFVHVHHWSTKSMIRELVLSRTYGMSSRIRDDAFAVDPGNETLWRMPRRRLEAEPLRDAMLAVSGLLRTQRPVDGSLVMQLGEGEVGRNLNTRVLQQPFDHRSVYLPIIRGLIPEGLRVFDFPEPSNVQGLRDANTTPTQALYLMNSPFAVRAAEHFARTLLDDPQLTDDQQRIERAHRLCFGRPPDAVQAREAAEFIAQLAQQTADEPDDAAAAGDHLAWSAYCQILMASAPFRFVD